MTDPAPRGVIFDFGGVIWDMRWDISRTLEETHSLPQGTVFKTLYRCGAWHAIERGGGDRDAWLAGAHRQLEASAGRSLPPLHSEWRARQGLIADNVALIRMLRGSYRLAILSNADQTLRAHLADHLGIIDLFDAVICSAEEGMAKPDPAIYRLACERLGLSPPACVFVDDYAPNVEAARGVGLTAVLYRVDRGDDLRGLLAGVGVRPSPES